MSATGCATGSNMHKLQRSSDNIEIAMHYDILPSPLHPGTEISFLISSKAKAGSK